MQIPNWNDLRYLLAIRRHDRLAAAARSLKVDDTTVSRRLAAMQSATGRRLYQRLQDGRLALTEAGESLAEIAERIERDIGGLRSDDSSDGAAGVVRLTSVPVVINRILVPAAGRLFDRHPGLRLELLAESRDLSLTRREADMALRLARPKTGGLRIKARRLGKLVYAAYAPTDRSKKDASSLPWITYDESMAHLPQARWMAAAIRVGDGQASSLLVNDVEAAHEAVAAGLGRSMLPRLVAGRDTRLEELGSGHDAEARSRELWLLIHTELIDLPRIRAVVDWIEDVFPAGSP